MCMRLKRIKFDFDICRIHGVHAYAYASVSPGKMSNWTVRSAMNTKYTNGANRMKENYFKNQKNLGKISFSDIRHFRESNLLWETYDSMAMPTFNSIQREVCVVIVELKKSISHWNQTEWDTCNYIKVKSCSYQQRCQRDARHEDRHNRPIASETNTTWLRQTTQEEVLSSGKASHGSEFELWKVFGGYQNHFI